jgi:hypothetical protein
MNNKNCMKNTLLNNISKISVGVLMALALVIAVMPNQAHAFKLIRLIDPFCITCNNDEPQTVVNNVTDSNNVINSNNVVNSNNTSTVVTNSPGANVSTYSAPTISNVRNSRNSNPPAANRVIATNNTYNYGYSNTYESANVYPTTQSYPTYQSSLSVSCYSNLTSVNTGDSVLWVATPAGGNGNFYVTWSGSDGLSGYGTSISKTYNTAGSKYASVTVTSGGQTASQNCISNVNVRNNNNYYSNNNNYNYPSYNYNYNSPLSVSCYANTTSGAIGSNISWQANATGGAGYYTYSWTGTDYLNGYGSYVNKTYNNPGSKTATVTVTSGGQTITKMCSNSVGIGSINYNQNYSYYPDYGYNQNYNYNQNYVYSPVTSSGLQIACFPDKVSARVGASVTWAIEAIGGSGNFTYAWTGSEGLSSNQSSVITTYGTTGQKSATVTVTSNGQTITQACGSKVNITSAYVAPRPTNNNYQNPQINYQNQQDNSLSAASLFSLKNVPWGWVAVLVILVLMFTVMYLIFNRNKI